jgi:hypothetical protein
VERLVPIGYFFGCFDAVLLRAVVLFLAPAAVFDFAAAFALPAVFDDAAVLDFAAGLGSGGVMTFFQSQLS